MSPIRLRHMSLIHPQTPINRSLPKAFKKGPSHLEHKQHQRRFKSTQKYKNSVEIKPQSLQELQPQNRRTLIRSRIIQTICLDPKVCWNQAQKPPKISTNHKSMKLYEFKPPKPRSSSTTNLQIRRTFEEKSSKLSS